MWISIFLLPLCISGRETCDAETEECYEEDQNVYLPLPGEEEKLPELEEIKTQLNELIQELFMAADGDSNGFLDAQEMNIFVKVFEDTYKGLKLGIIDKDGDGIVVLEEAQKTIQEVFFPILLRELQGGGVSFPPDELDLPPISEEPLINRDGVVIRW